jgi:hypothetical protein
MYFETIRHLRSLLFSLSHCHGGQWSKEYARLCKLTREGFFKPSPFLSVETLTENWREIYENACNKFLGG